MATQRLRGVHSGLGGKAPAHLMSRTNLTLYGFQAVDGITLATTDPNLRIVVAGQTDATENGVYKMASNKWVREPDCDGSADWTQGTMIYITDGGLYGNTLWWFTFTPTVTPSAPFVPGTTTVGTVRWPDGHIPGGPMQFGIITGGFIQGGARTQVTEKYTYDTNTSVSGGNLNTAKYQMGAAGNDIYGVHAGGSTSVATVKTSSVYTYSLDTFAAGTDLGFARYNLAGSSTYTVAYFFGGAGAAGVGTKVDKYTLATNAVASGTALGLERSALAAAGNTSVTVIGGGFTSAAAAPSSTSVTYTDLYTHATDVVVQGGNLDVIRYQHTAVNNQSLAIFIGGRVSGSVTTGGQTSIYNFTTNVTAPGVASGVNLLLSPRENLASCGDGTVGAVANGLTSGALDTALLTRVTLATQIFATGVTLGTERYSSSASSYIGSS